MTSTPSHHLLRSAHANAGEGGGRRRTGEHKEGEEKDGDEDEERTPKKNGVSYVVF